MARKHLKVRAVLNLKDDCVEVTVLEQTHFNLALGIIYKEAGMEHGDTFLHYPVRFISDTCTAGYVFSPTGSCTGELWVYLAGSSEALPFKFKVPLKIWPQIKAAIIAYNEWGEKQ